MLGLNLNDMFLRSNEDKFLYLKYKQKTINNYTIIENVIIIYILKVF